MILAGIDVFSDRPLRLEVDEGKIIAIQELESRVGLPYISPGFLDMQVNGFSGSDYSLEELDRGHVIRIIQSLAAAGTTQHVPTFITMPQERLLRNLSVVTRSIRQSKEIDAAISGFHIEGPFISPEDGPRGAHDRSYVRLPDYEEFLAWQEAADGMIAYLTLAPELDGALDFIRRVVLSGVKVSIGHSRAAPEIIRQAVDAGASMSTHLGNGSDSMLPRLKNYLWEQLATDGLFASCIGDGFHLPGSVVKVIARAKTLERLILVSDAALLGGYSPGLYKWGALDVEVFDDGHIGLPGTTMLAGAAHLLDWDIPHFMACTASTLGEAIKLCTVNPARFLDRLPPLYGRLTVGAPANLCVFRHAINEPRLEVLQTYLRGSLVFS